MAVFENWKLVFEKVFIGSFKIAITLLLVGSSVSSIRFFHPYCDLSMTSVIPSTLIVVNVTLLRLHFVGSFKQYSLNHPVLRPNHGGCIAVAESNPSYCHVEPLSRPRFFKIPRLTLHSNTTPSFPNF